MVAAMVEREPVATIAPAERRVELRCQDCGRTVGVLGIRSAIAPGLIWTRIRCPDRRCTRWNCYDAATGEPLGGGR